MIHRLSPRCDTVLRQKILDKFIFVTLLRIINLNTRKQYKFTLYLAYTFSNVSQSGCIVSHKHVTHDFDIDEK